MADTPGAERRACVAEEDASIRAHTATTPPRDWRGAEVLLLRACSDEPLERIVGSLRRHFPGARITLLTASVQSPPVVQVDACRVHGGDKRVLLTWVRERRWDVVAIPWTGEPILGRWKTILPWLARAQHRVVFNERGDFFRLGRSGLRPSWRHLRWRLETPTVIPSIGFRPPAVRVSIDAVAGPLAVARMAVRVPLLLGAAWARTRLASRRPRAGP